MIYAGDISYNEPYFQYNGVRIVAPSSFGPNSVVSNPKVLAVIILRPPGIGSTLVFVDTNKIISSAGFIEITDSNSSMSFSTLNNQEGFMVFSVADEDAFAITDAQTIVLDQNQAGTVDVTIIPTA